MPRLQDTTAQIRVRAHRTWRWCRSWWQSSVRGLPALVYRRAIDARRTVVAGLLQATTLPFVVTATTIGVELELVGPAESAALVAAGLLSVLLFPLAGVLLLRRTEPAAGERV